MKLSTMIGGVKFSFENNDDLIKQLEEELAKLDKQLAEFDKLKKRKWFLTKAIRQLKSEGEPAKQEPTVHP